MKFRRNPRHIIRDQSGFVTRRAPYFIFSKFNIFTQWLARRLACRRLEAPHTVEADPPTPGAGFLDRFAARPARTVGQDDGRGDQGECAQGKHEQAQSGPHTRKCGGLLSIASWRLQSVYRLRPKPAAC